MVKIKCFECGNITKNKKFCSRSCSAISNNKTIKKKQFKWKNCIICNTFLNRKNHQDNW